MNKHMIFAESTVPARPAIKELRQKALVTKSRDLLNVKVGGRFMTPRKFGIYRVWLLIDGHLRYFHYFGTHPVRQYRLARKFGEAHLVALFENWADAKGVTYLLNGNRRMVS